MLRVLFKALLVASLLAASVGPVGAQGDSTAQYTSADGTFSFDYPNGWLVIPNEGMVLLANSEGALTALNEGFSPGSEQAVSMIFEPATIESFLQSSGQSAASLPEILGVLLQAMEMPFDTSAAEERAIGGKSAAVVSISLDVVEGLLLVTDLDGAYFALFAFMSPGTRATFEPMLLAVAESAGADMASSPLLGTLVGHTGSVLDIAFSFDGQTLTSVGGYDDSTIRQWRVLASEEMPGMSIAFGETGNERVMSSDGSLIASYGQWGSNTITLWDAVTGQRLQTLTDTGNKVNGVVFDVYGFDLSASRVASAGCVADDQSGMCQSDSGYVSVWDIGSGAPIITLPIPLSEGASLANLVFSPDGRYLAAGGCSGWSPASGGCAGGELMVWDLNTGQQVVDQSLDPISAIDFSPDNQTIAVGMCEYEGVDCIMPYVGLLDVTTSKMLGTLSAGNREQIIAIEFESVAGNLLATATAGNNINVWKVANSELLQTFIHPGGINRLRFHPYGTLLASAGDNGTIKLWSSSLWYADTADAGLFDDQVAAIDTLVTILGASEGLPPQFIASFAIGIAVGNVDYLEGVWEAIVGMPDCLSPAPATADEAAECVEAWRDINDRMWDDSQTAIEHWDRVAIEEGFAHASIALAGKLTAPHDLFTEVLHFVTGAIHLINVQVAGTDALIAVTNWWISDMGLEAAEAQYTLLGG